MQNIIGYYPALFQCCRLVEILSLLNAKWEKEEHFVLIKRIKRTLLEVLAEKRVEISALKKMGFMVTLFDGNV